MRAPRVILSFIARLACVAPICGLLLTGPVQAQVPLQTPPLVQAVDPNGVNLLGGGLERREVHASVGGQGAQGLAEFAYDTSSITMNYGVSLPRGWAGKNVMTAVVALGGASYNFDRFVSTPSAFVDSRKTGGALKFDTGPFAFIFTANDGTIYRFSARYTLTPSEVLEDQTDLNVAAIDSITYPTGEVVTFYYRDSAYLGTQNFYRLQSTVSSLGYQLKYEYVTDTPEAFGFQLVNRVTAINMAYDTCDPAAAHCTLANTYPVSTYGRNYDETGTGGQPYVLTYDDAMLRRTSEVDTATLMLTRASGASKAVTHAYDSYLKANVITSVSDGVGTWGYQFTPVNSVVTVTDPVGHSTTYNYAKRTGITKVTDAQGRQTSYVYDLSARLTNAEFPEGNGVIYTRDNRNNVTQTGYYAKGSGGAVSITTSAGFDAVCTAPKTCNQPRYTVDARGAQTDYTYDEAHGGVLTKTLPAGPNGIRPTVTYAYQAFYAWYRNPAGVLTQSATPAYRLVSESACQTQATCAGTADEVRTVYTYGAPGTPNNLQVTSKTVQSGDGALAATTSFTYTPAGDVKTVDGPMPDDTVTYFYNAARQKLGEVGPDPDGSGPLKRRATRTTYNAGGLPSLVEQGTVEGASDADWANFAPLMGSATTYDTREHKVQDSLVSGGAMQSVSQYSYDQAGRLACSAQRMNPAVFNSPPASACTAGSAGADGPDRITVNTYDEVNRIIAVTQAAGTAEARTERVTFTANGLKLTDADGKGNLTTYEYDGYDRLVKVRYPSVTCCTSSTTDYEAYDYDGNGNRTSWRRRDGATVGFVYDALNRAQNGLRGEAYAYDNLGRRVSATFAGQTASATFDPLGRMTTETTNGLTMTYGHDLTGRRTRITWPDGFAAAYQYDATGAITVIQDIYQGVTTTIAAYAYDNLGRRDFNWAGVGTPAVTSDVSYDGASRLSSLAHDLVGTDKDQTWTFTYNAAGQVKTRTASNSVYEWSSVQASKAYAVNGLNQYTTAAGSAYQYDARGNLQNGGGKAYGYDLANNLTSASGVTLTYEPTGRLWSVNPDTPRNFLYSGSDLVAEYNAGALVRRYMPGPGTDAPVIWYEGAGVSDRRFLLADPQGSIVAVTNKGGSSLYTNTYDEYGIPGSNNQGRFQYTGQVWLSSVGVYHYKARAYSPTLGRFLQTDPSGYDDGLNWYAYVGNDPINRGDPDGQSWESFKSGFLSGNMSGWGAYQRPNGNDASFKAGWGIGVATAVVTHGFLLAQTHQDISPMRTSVAEPAVVTVSRTRYPQSAAHIEEAQAAGRPSVLTVDRAGAAANRAAALKGTAPVAGHDRDEYPPAMFQEGGAGASVKPISPSDNRGAGSCIGNQCRNIPDGTKVKMKVTE